MAAEQHSSISETLAAYASSLTLAKVPTVVVERAKLHILDALGVALAASTFDFATITLAALRHLGDTGGVPVIGFPVRLPVRDAALLNGTLIHGLDFDDTHMASIVHPSASAVATVLSAGTRHRVSGHELLLAYLAAVEIDARLGAAVTGDFHRVGLHPTGLLGAFGCAIAAGRLAGLTARQLTNAQGIVLSMAGGSLEFLEEGAWTKRVHPGWAAVCGITAAALAAEGFIGPRLAYEGRFGLYRMHLGNNVEVDWNACTKRLGSQWEMLGVSLKPYPSCHFTHAFIDAALGIVRQYELAPNAIRSIKARIADGEVSTVCEPEANKRRPRNAYEAQFSVHYAIATSLIRKRFTLAELTSDCLTDPQILALCERIHYEIDPHAPFPLRYTGHILLTTHDGRLLSQHQAGASAHQATALSKDQVLTKFRQNAGLALGPGQVQRVLDQVMVLEELPDASLLAESLCPDQPR